MVKLTLEYRGKVAADTLKNNMDAATRRVRKAMKSIADQAAELILEQGVADIQQAGRYGRDWTSGLHTRVRELGADEFVVEVYHDKPYFSFLAKGGTIKGEPLLWLPTENMDVEGREGGGHAPPSEYPGKLIRATGKSGIPLLIDPNVDDPRAGWRTGAVMYTGEQFVIMPQKFHILEIVRQVARQMKSSYKIAYSTAR